MKWKGYIQERGCTGVTIDKIKHHLENNIINTIDLLINTNKIDILKKWRKDLLIEIKRRCDENIDIYPLQYELKYLDSMGVDAE